MQAERGVGAVLQLADGGDRFVKAGESGGDDGPFRRLRGQFEGGFGDDGQGAEGAGVETVEVVAGDIFDYFAAGFGDDAVGAGYGDANQPVAGQAVGGAQDAADAGGQCTADGGLARQRGAERHELAVGGQGGVQLGEGHSRLDADGEVGGLQVGQLVEGGQIQDDAGAGGAVAHRDEGAPAGGIDGQAGAAGAGDDGRDAAGVRRADDGSGDK